MYDYYNCSITQTLGPTVTQPTVTWREDVSLPTPVLAFPRPAAVLCPERLGSSTGILLQWQTVAGATHYIVQWGANPQLSNPTVREQVVSAPTQSYELQYDSDIRIGETVYWRVLAVNRVTGGVSQKSEVRQLTYECSRGSGITEPDRCSLYDVQLNVKGTEYVSCCDENTFWLEATFKCEDQFQNKLIQIQDIEWAISTDPNGGTVAFVKQELEQGQKVIVETCGEYSQVIKITATVTFADYINSDTFECQTEKLVFMDCDTPFHNRPWSLTKDNDICEGICLHRDFIDYYPVGLLYNPECEPSTDCSDICLDVIDASTFTGVLAKITYTLDVVQSICPGEDLLVAGYLQLTGTPIPADPLSVTVEVTTCDGTVSDVYSVYTTPVPVDLSVPFVGGVCECDVTVSVTVESQGPDVGGWAFEGLGTTITPDECKLNSYEGLAVATGPVFKVPVPCEGVYTECCECTPAEIGFLVDSRDGYGGFGTLSYSEALGLWEEPGRVEAFGVPNFIGPAQLYCYEGLWHFDFAFGNPDCEDSSLCPCLPAIFEATVDWSTTSASGTKVVTFTSIGSGLWDSDALNFTPVCGDSLQVELRLDMNSGAISPTITAGWATQSNSFTLNSCDPFDADATLVFRRAGCENVTLDISWSVDPCEPCVTVGSLTETFEACDPFYAALEVSYPSWPNPIDILIGVDDEGCLCNEGLTNRPSALEARVNIPLSCHFKVVNGQLALNLEQLIGPGIGIGYNMETGCEYLYAMYSEPTMVMYYETIIYCCYGYYDQVFLPDAGFSMGSEMGLQAFDPDISGTTFEEGTPISGLYVTALGGTLPYAFSIATGSLPAGLSLDADTGEISGTPTTSGAFSVSFTVTDDLGSTDDTLGISGDVEPEPGGGLG